MTRQIETTVVILNFNGKKYLRGCLDSLLRQTYRSFDILLVDNGSSDDSVPFIKQTYATPLRSGRLRLILNKKNEGFARGNNIGYKAAKGKFVVLLNNDTILPKDWLSTLIRPLQRHPDISIVGTAYHDKGKMDEHRAFVRGKDGSSINPAGENIVVPRTTVHEKTLIEAFFVSGNGVALRKKDIRLPVPFDDDYFAYAEDTYLGWMAQLQGKNVVLNIASTMEHVGGGTKKVMSQAFNKYLLFHGSKNSLMNALLFYEWKNIFRTMPYVFLTHLGHIIDNPRKFPVKVKAVWWIMTHLRSIIRKRRAIQATRRVSDKEIIGKMSGKFFDEKRAQTLYNPFYNRVIRLLNSLALFYCRIVRLPVLELKK